MRTIERPFFAGVQTIDGCSAIQVADQNASRARQRTLKGPTLRTRRYCPALRLCRPKPFHTRIFQERGLQPGPLAPPTPIIVLGRSSTRQDCHQFLSVKMSALDSRHLLTSRMSASIPTATNGRAIRNRRLVPKADIPIPISKWRQTFIMPLARPALRRGFHESSVTFPRKEN